MLTPKNKWGCAAMPSPYLGIRRPWVPSFLPVGRLSRTPKQPLCCLGSGSSHLVLSYQEIDIFFRTLGMPLWKQLHVRLEKLPYKFQDEVAF